MAHRDRSSGFSFMYVDITKLLEQKKEVEKQEDAPVLTNNVRTANFGKDPKPAVAAVGDVAPAVSPKETVLPSTAFMRDREAAIEQIKSNLDRLQSLHHKLHAMLEDLNKITDKKKS